MKLSEFDFDLPQELIAREPMHPRDAAKLLVLNAGNLSDRRFCDLPEILQSGDVLVFNDSKVIPARLFGESCGRKFEVLLVKNIQDSVWECWVKPGRRARVGEKFTFGGNLSAVLKGREAEIFFFEFNLAGTEFYSELSKVGEMPIPPYILKARGDLHEEREDHEEYQTIYAKRLGSAAAPTAGLHFTEELIANLRAKGIQTEFVTLHVGLGTFQPVTTEVVEEFNIHSEYYEINSETTEKLNKAKSEGRRIIAVGTTSVRVLESAADESGKLTAKSGETSIYIYPGYRYKIVDGIVTNFHLPKSSLLLLVSAFAGKEEILKAYDYAIENKYRFYSYGDGMLIL